MALTRPKFYQVDTTITAFNDPITVLRSGATQANVDVGFLFNRANGLVSNVALVWSEATQSFITAYTDGTGATNSNISVSSYANIKTGNITANGFFWANGVVFSSGSTFTGGYVPNTIIAAANLVANSGVVSTSSTTGALVVAGGSGIAGALYVGGTGNFAGNLTTGHILPSANITYDIGSPTLRFRTLYISGNTIDMGGASITTDSTSGGFAFVPKPTSDNPNPIGTVFGPTGSITTVNTTGGVLDSGAINTSINTNQGIANFGRVIIKSDIAGISTTTGALVVSGGVGIAGALYIANTGDVSANIGSLLAYAGGQAAGINSINANLGTATTNITTLFSNAAGQSNQITGANTAIVTANSAVVSFIGTINTNLSTAITGNTNAANAAIVTANTSLKSYVDTQNGAITTAWTANAAGQANQITGANAAIVTANSAVVSFVGTINNNLSTAITANTNAANAAIVTANSAVVSFVGTINNNLSTAITANTNAANAAIVTANTSLKSYVDTQDSAITTAWTANAATQAASIRTLDANLGTATTNITTLFSNAGTQQTQINSLASGANANVAAYLPGYTGSLGSITTLTTSGTATVGGNLNVSGNLNVTGNVSYFSSNDLVVTDSLIYLADGNTGDVLDIGIVSAFTNPGYQHTGLVRDASDGVWKLFANVVAEPSTTVDFTNAIYSPLRIGALTATSGTYSGAIIASTVSAGTIGNSGATLTGTLSSGAQNNITSATGITALGTITSLAATTAVVTNFSSGNIQFTNATSGTVSTANVSLYESVTATTTNAAFYPYLADKTSGNTGSFTSTSLVFNPSTGNLVLGGTTTSTSTTTGALVVAGGVGVAGRIFAGNIVTTSGVYWANGAAYSSGSGGGITYTTSNTAPSSPSAGNFWYEPATDIKYQYINDGTSSYWVDQSYPTSFGNLTVANTLTVNGSIVGTATNANYSLAANVAIYESVTATTTNATFYPMLSGITTGNTASFTSSSLVYNPSTGNLVVASTTASTSTTTGALVVSGGVGISGNIVTAGTANKFTGCVAIGSSNPTHKLQISADGYNTRISDSTNATGYNIGRNTTDGLLYFYGDQATYNGYVFSGADGERVKISSTGNLVINATTSSSTTTSGALVVKGGAGIAGTMTVGGTITGKTNTGGVAAVSNDAGSLSVRGDATNAAVISFHRPSLYAINMGLDTDDVFKIGGWSATANCFQLTGAGALTLTSGITTAGSIVPSANLTYNLGSTTAWWNNVYGVSVQAKYADLAEHYTADDLYGPGTVVVFGGAKEITVSNISHDPRVAGVISTNPAYLMNAANAGLPVALTGRVPCQVQGPVAKGDRLVNIDTGIAGRLDPALHEYGCIVGKSLGEIADDSIQTIEIVVGRF